MSDFRGAPEQAFTEPRVLSSRPPRTGPTSGSGASRRAPHGRSHAHTCGPRPGGPIVNTVRIDIVSHEQMWDQIQSFIRCGQSHVMHFCAAHPTVEARSNPAYRDIMNAGDLNLPDGMAVVWASRLFGYPAQKLSGTDSMNYIMSRGLQSGIRHFLYGGTPQALAGMQTELPRNHAGIQIAGAASPPFRDLTDDEMAADAASVRESRAHILWIGLGTPKQDLTAERLRRLDTAPVIACVGAAFDFIGGTMRRAPVSMQRMGLEWAYRLVSDPVRLWQRYLIGNPQFVFGVMRDRLWEGGFRR